MRIINALRDMYEYEGYNDDWGCRALRSSAAPKPKPKPIPKPKPKPKCEIVRNMEKLVKFDEIREK